MSADEEPGPYTPPLSHHPKTVRARERREAAQIAPPPIIARIGDALTAIGRRMDAMFHALGGEFVPAGRKARICAKCGIARHEHREGGRAWEDDRHKPVSIAPSLLQLGRVGKLYPSATLKQEGNTWAVVEPLTGFVRGRGKSRRAALRAACRGGGRVA